SLTAGRAGVGRGPRAPPLPRSRPDPPVPARRVPATARAPAAPRGSRGARLVSVPWSDHGGGVLSIAVRSGPVDPPLAPDRGADGRTHRAIAPTVTRRP